MRDFSQLHIINQSEEIRNSDEFMDLPYESSFDETFEHTALTSQKIRVDPLHLHYNDPYMSSSQDLCDLSFLLNADVPDLQDSSSMESCDDTPDSSIDDYVPDEFFSNDFLPDEIFSNGFDVKEIEKTIEKNINDEIDNFLQKTYSSSLGECDHGDTNALKKPIHEVATRAPLLQSTKLNPYYFPPRPHNSGLTVQKSIPNESIKKEDVLFGRGKRTTNHAGNKFFRELVSSMSAKYKGCSKVQKTALSNSIVSAILKKGGRFLSPLPNDCNAWVEMKGLALRRKTSQALRDCRIYTSNKK